ncbi:hypothetical protein ABT237_20930 [Streptomyces sp. NPDC001581]|uniref:hypothetical protein n=1 Tax=Streptomyces sp. NPDC001581 TaxID=3154386 RepID=UPI00331F3B70
MAERLPIESVETFEGVRENLIPYVMGELRHKEIAIGSLEDRVRGIPRSPAGQLYQDLYDVGVDLRNHAGAAPDDFKYGVTQKEATAACDNVTVTAAAYALLAYPRFTPDLEQPEAIATLWPVLQERGEMPTPNTVGTPGLHLTEQQADLLARAAQRVGITCDKSQTFVSAAPAFAAWGRDHWSSEDTDSQ